MIDVPPALESLDWLGWVLAALVSAVVAEFGALVLSFRQLLRMARETTAAAVTMSAAVAELQSLIRDIKAADDAAQHARELVANESLSQIRTALSNGFSELRQDFRAIYRRMGSEE